MVSVSDDHQSVLGLGITVHCRFIVCWSISYDLISLSNRL